jgi:hypothetical protein
VIPPIYNNKKRLSGNHVIYFTANIFFIYYICIFFHKNLTIKNTILLYFRTLKNNPGTYISLGMDYNFTKIGLYIFTFNINADISAYNIVINHYIQVYVYCIQKIVLDVI